MAETEVYPYVVTPVASSIVIVGQPYQGLTYFSQSGVASKHYKIARFDLGSLDESLICRRRPLTLPITIVKIVILPSLGVTINSPVS